VICIEADPVAAARLRGNLPVNPDLSGKIEVIERAFASTSGKVRLGVKRKPGDSMSSVLWTQSEIGWAVDAITPAELAAMARGASKVFLKVDIEGSEYEVLPHIGPLLDFPEVTALISFHPQFLPGGRSDWTPEVARLTARALQPFSSSRSFAVTDRAITSLPMASVLDEVGGTRLPVRDRWLFIKSAQ
jgi:FkbM family methyltransferase